MFEKWLEKKIGFLIRIKFTFFLILILLIPFITLIVTQCESRFSLGLTKANEIGDAIGGTLGPYLSFIGSCLVAYTIYLQISQRKEDKLRYEADIKRLEDETKSKDQKDFEKVIFENCLQMLKNVEGIIYELNLSNQNEKWASNGIFDEYFKTTKIYTLTTLKVHQFMYEFNDALNLYNDNKVSLKSFHTIIICSVKKIVDLTRGNILGKFNKKSEFDNEQNFIKNHFFQYSRLEQYYEVKNFYENLKILYNYPMNDPNLVNEIINLKTTCDILNEIEEDLNTIHSLKNPKNWDDDEPDLYEDWNSIRRRQGLLDLDFTKVPWS